MQTWDAITSRRNVRTFADRPIPPADLDRILEAGRRSPSSQNWQPWDFILVTDREQLSQKIAVVAHRDLGFKVARFQRLSGSDLLVSANYKYAPLDISNASKWKVFGEVLWWVSRDGRT